MTPIKIAFTSLLFVAACGTTVSTLPLRPITAQPRPVMSVGLFMTPPPQPHYAVARLEAHDALARSANHMISKLREEAARLGCDGVLVDPLDHHVDRHHVSDLAGACIMFTPATAAPSAAPGAP